MAALVAGERARMYALGGVARGGATRGGYHSPKLFVAINGVHYATARAVEGQQVDNDTLTLTNASPNKCSFDVRGFVPAVGDEVVVTMGTKNSGTREFAGNVLNRTVSYVGSPANRHDHVNAIDFSWALNSRKVTKRYVTMSGTAIAQDLFATFAPGFTTRNVEAGLPVLDEITFTNQDVNAARAQLAKRLGATEYIDFFRDWHLFTTEPLLTDPQPLVDGDTDTLESFDATFDASQFYTRVIVEGGGVNALAEIVPGETILPVEDAAWYEPTGGVIASGPQRMTYTSAVDGGGGSLIGPGAAPASAPAGVVLVGTGLAAGTYRYGYTDKTPTGESLPSPPLIIVVGTVTDPSSAPTFSPLLAGTGPEDGSHDYASTFTTATGESRPSPLGTVVTGLLAVPTAPTAGTPTTGAAGVTDGSHDYELTCVNAAGETTPSPVSASVVTSTHVVAPPGTAPTTAHATSGAGASGWVVGDTIYTVYTYLGAGGQTTPSPNSNTIIAQILGAGPAAKAITVAVLASSDPLVTLIRVYVNKNGSWLGYNDVANTNASPEFANATSLGSPPGSNTAVVYTESVPLTLPLGGPTTTSRKVYRRFNGTGTFQLAATVADNSTTLYTDTVPNASLGAAAPSSNTAHVNKVPVTGLPIGGVSVTGRKLYRTAAGGAQLKLLATIADNTTTTFDDTLADASLGANAPTVNTAGGNVNQVSLSAIAIGPGATTQRKVYRSVANGTSLKLLTTLADNVTTTFVDSTPDGSLGADVPTGDTSALTLQTGQVIAGSISIPLAGAGAFNPTGGWMIIGNAAQLVRYTGISGNNLTGVPATGPGALAATVAFNSTATAAPTLRGVPASGAGSILYTIKKGDPVNLVVQEDDLAAQAVLAAVLSTDTYTHDGVIEDVVTDNRLSHTEAVARAQAQLALRNAIEVSAHVVSRDINMRLGRTLDVDLTTMGVNQAFKIQQVNVSRFTPSRAPYYDVTASSNRFSFEDLLRMARKDVN